MHHKPLYILTIFIVILTMSGCQSTPGTNTGSLRLDNLDPSELLEAANKTSSVNRAALLRLNAAEQYLAQGDAISAANILAALAPEDFTATDVYRLRRLQAEIALARGDSLTAAQILSTLPLESPEDYILIAEACAANNDHTCAADGWIQASLTLGMNSPDLPADIHDQIWSHLSRARSGPQVFSHRYHHAWWTLQQEIRQAGSITAQVSAWRTWQAKNPSHPARLQPPAALTQLEQYRPPNIAVMLPLSGNLAAAGEAVRDGIVAAYLEEQNSEASFSPNDMAKAKVHFYDTANQPIAEVWEDVLAGDHDVTVGPLIKDNVQRFADVSTFSELPRLSLNYLNEGNDNPSGIFQLGIAIEDEARSLVTHMLLAGYERVMMIHSDSSWSQRARDAFLEQWPFPISTSSFADIKDLTAAVGDAMLTAESEARKTELQRILGTQLEFLPRARDDLEAIVALTSNVESQALVPALRFHFGDHLPIYATSQAARSGRKDDLAGFNMTELPALTNDRFDALNRTFSIQTSNFAELYALGFDAFRVGTWLPLLSSETQMTLPGATGYLWLDTKGVIRRELDLTTVVR